MRKFVIVACLLAGAAVAGAQDATPGKADKTPRLGIINFRKVSEDSLVGKSYRAQGKALSDQIEAEQKKKKLDLDKMDAEIKTLGDALTAQAETLPEEAREKKRQEIVAKTRFRDAFVEDGRADLERMRQRGQAQAAQLDGDLQKKILAQIEIVAKAQGLDAILLEGQSVLTINRSFDITGEVIVKLDEAEKTKGASAPAAKPTASAPAK
jgi:Skp family chaperone for outer membrane proteins